ncbi:hypothetical protein [Rhodovulum visakhapatnamense]|uniref:Uncharacterized protein n=1 Tax=Rhodovulum visakhapatnamense TaxID=364297 RepID=A0A4R8FAL7_9RHOB|nr:hypothetical protein [Rhodovulum visakhapatnamense]TDX22579.1 hypothetical protein EV657_12917 [Rhodovulum visakhapatnamense]
MTPDHTQKGKTEPSIQRPASDVALSFSRLAPDAHARIRVFPVLAVAGAALTALVSVLAVTAVPPAQGRAPEAALALGRDATPVEGSVLLAGADAARAAPLAPVTRPEALSRVTGPAEDGLDAVAEARAAQGQQAARLMLAAYPATAGGTALPNGLHVYAGPPDVAPPARPGAQPDAPEDQLAQLRPHPRPLAEGGDARRPRPRPSAEAPAAATDVVASLSAENAPRPHARPETDADTAGTALPEASGTDPQRPLARPVILADAADSVRPQARPIPLAVAASGASLVPAPGIERAAAFVPPVAAPAEAAVPEAASAAPAEQGLKASLRPQTRPAALARLARGALVPEERRSAAPRAEPFAHTDIARGANGCSMRLARGIPNRGRGALDGREIGSRMGGLHGGDRDSLIVQQALAGNIPHFLRELTPVKVSGTLPGGGRADVTICVTPDYLALGSDADFVRVPMGLPAAARIADRFGFLLPTTRMVDAIYAQAGLRLDPRPMTAGAQMSSTGYFLQHNRTVEGQTGGREGQLTAGQKKDLVLTNRLRSHPGRVAIYGWHKRDGSPIQPLSTVHGAYYSDYSHGVRLVSQTAFLNGRAVSLASLLSNPTYAQMLTGEGPIDAPERLMASLYR